jgi:hypothetical protein
MRIMTMTPEERQLIQETISDLEDGITELQEKRDMMDWDISRKQDRLKAWQGKLAALSGEVPPATEPHKRAPRGANLKSVLALLMDPAGPRQGLSTAALVDKTGLPFSSVQAALKQGEQQGVIEQNDSGFWRPKQPDPLQSTMEMNGKIN